MPQNKVKGGRNGLETNNSFTKKVTSLINVEELKSSYLTGLNISDPLTGEALSDQTYKLYIDNAVSMLEHYLDISITPVTDYVELKDYRMNDYVEWGFFQLDNYPCIAIKKLELVYFRDENGEPTTVTTIPLNWIRLQAHDGLVRLVANAKIAPSLQVGQSGTFFPELLRASMVPHAWRFTYDYGFCDGQIPTLMNYAIAALAAIQALTVGGNLVLGAGIASSSISIDGLSQSIGTTASAENSAYSATILDYSKRIFGTRDNDPFAVLGILKDYYKGSQMNII